MRALLYTLLLSLHCFCSIAVQRTNESEKSERVYLHTDRNMYVAGEDLFYKVYLPGISSQMSKYAYLDIRNSHNSLITSVQLEIKNQVAFGNIYLSDTLHSDIYQVVCFTNSMRNEGEGTYFTKEIVIANRFDRKLELFDPKFNINPVNSSPAPYSGNLSENENLVIHLDKQVFNVREKVSFSIETNDISCDSLIKLSVSVSAIIPGIPIEPSISDYLNNPNKSAKTVDLQQDQIYYLPEIEGVAIQGRILASQQSGNSTDMGNTKPKRSRKSYTLLVSTPDSIANMQYATTDSLGIFRFFLNRYYEGKELILRLTENANVAIELDNKFKLIQPFIPSNKFQIPDIKSYLIRSIDIFEVQRNYTIKAQITLGKVLDHFTNIPRVYYKPYFKIFPADYLQLSDFAVISQELLPTLKIRKSNDGFILSCIDQQNKASFSLNPTIFLDGVPINDVNQLINLGSSQIKCIEILPVSRYYGELLLSGILAVQSKNKEINKIQFKTPTIRYQTLSSEKYTKPIPYTRLNINNKIPDVRQLLLWDPEINLHLKEKQQIEFYTSDLQGNYLINIQGITSNGLPVNGSAIIKVKSEFN